MTSDDGLNDVKWDKVKLPATMARSQLEAINIGMLVLTCVVFVTRLVVRVFQRKPYELHDFFCHSAFVCYIAMWVMYFKENDPLYRTEGVQRGEIPPYPGICESVPVLQVKWSKADHDVSCST